MYKPSEELHNFCLSSDMFHVIKSGRIRWMGLVARMEYKNLLKILVEDLR
jgi:hypothetical protein